MPSETKIKVSKDKLIEAIRARRDEAATAHAAQVAEYPSLLKAWQADMDQLLCTLTDRAARGKRLDIPYGEGNPPTVPSNFDSTKYDRHIAMLEMSPEETVSVNTSDFGTYLR